MLQRVYAMAVAALPQWLFKIQTDILPWGIKGV
jgi:hypothetical protein